MTIEGETTRTVKVGQPLTLVARVDDDGVPKPRGGGQLGAGDSSSSRRAAAANDAGRAMRRVFTPPARVTVAKMVGLHLSWIVYRGTATNVTFTPDQMKTWTDTPAYANKPRSPPYIIPEPPPGNR